MNTQRYIGKRIARSDALEKTMGKALFAADIKMAGMLHGKILRSPHAHARITRIDTAETEEISGVKAVITSADIEGRFDNYGAAITDQSIVATDKVRYAGDPVAAIAAVDPLTAEQALSSIQVEYAELPSVLTVDEALAEGAPLVHDRIDVVPALKALLNPIPGTNICTHFQLRHGNAEEGFQQADLVFEDTFTTEPVQHAQLEPHCSIATVLPGPRIEVLSNNQDPSNLQAQLSQIFRVPQNSIKVVVPFVGGGFGSKIGPKLEPIAVALAWKARLPVKVTLSREEDFVTISRHGSKVIVKTGVTKDGILVARHVAVYFDKGAYADAGPIVSKNTGFSAGGPYRIPHVAIDCYNVYTNKVPAGAMRGFGIPQVAWAYEQQMDMIAERLGLDPLEFRRNNLLRDKDIFHTGEVLEDTDLGKLLNTAAAGIGWADPKESQTHGIVLRGKGLSMGWKGTATPSTSGALIRMHDDGSVNLMCNTVEMGQGIQTVLKQIVAEELGVSLDRILVLEPDVSVAPFDTGTLSSRSTFHMGNAVLLAIEDLKNQLLDTAAAMLGAAPEDLIFADGMICVEVMRERSISLAQAVKGPASIRGNLLGQGVYRTRGSVQAGTAQGVAAFYWMSAAGGVELEVDTETGSVRILKCVGAVDAGRVLNPMNVEQQSLGSIVMGLGQAFAERMIYDGRGRLLNPNFVDYKTPTVKDLPDEIVAVPVEVGHRSGPYGAKGVGEVMIVPTLPAIANALYRATGCRFQDLPVTPEKILLKLLEIQHSEAVGVRNV